MIVLYLALGCCLGFLYEQWESRRLEGDEVAISEAEIDDFVQTSRKFSNRVLTGLADGVPPIFGNAYVQPGLSSLFGGALSNQAGGTGFSNDLLSQLQSQSHGSQFGSQCAGKLEQFLASTDTGP